MRCVKPSPFKEVDKSVEDVLAEMSDDVAAKDCINIIVITDTGQRNARRSSGTIDFWTNWRTRLESSQPRIGDWDLICICLNILWFSLEFKSGLQVCIMVPKVRISMIKIHDCEKELWRVLVATWESFTLVQEGWVNVQNESYLGNCMFLNLIILQH